MRFGRGSRLVLLVGFTASLAGAPSCGGREALYRPPPDAGGADDAAGVPHDAAIDRGPADRSTAEGGSDGSSPDGCAPAPSALGDGLCHYTEDCVAPGQCLDFMSGTGSCWPRCRPELSDATLHNPDCASDELCIGEGEPTSPVPPDQPVGCLGVVTFAGTFSDLPVVVDDESPSLGPADLVLGSRCLGEIRFTTGYLLISHRSGLEYHTLQLYPPDQDGPDGSRVLSVGFDTWPVEAGQAYDLDDSVGPQAYVDYLELAHSGSQLVQATGRALGRWGMVTIAAGSSTTGAPVSGAIADGVAFRYTWEICGPNAGPCAE